MSLACGIPILECVYFAGCVGWGTKKCIYIGAYDSEKWPMAVYEEFQPVPYICRVILAVYEKDLSKPVWPPPGGFRMNVEDLVKKTDYNYTGGHAPPYLIYVSHEEKDIVLAIRGLNMGQVKDYGALLNNRLGKREFDGGYVHHGLLKAAIWLLNKEAANLTEQVRKYPTYTLTFAGHSLGSGVAAMMTMLVAKNKEALGNISRDRLRGFCVAPARSMSLNLALQYADIIHSVILQDDFLPRTSTPLQDIFGVALCLPFTLMFRCFMDTCTSEKKKLHDPRRLYAPGRMYHIVERRFFSCGRFPPEVRTNVPVEGRFEHIVLSCNATQDHSLVEIEKEAEIVLELLRESARDQEVPPTQMMERRQNIAEDHRNDRKAALETAQTLKIPNSDFSTEDLDEEEKPLPSSAAPTPAHAQSSGQDGNEAHHHNAYNWNDLVEQLFLKSESRHAGGFKDAGNASSGGPTKWNDVRRLFLKGKRGEQDEPQEKKMTSRTSNS